MSRNKVWRLAWFANCGFQFHIKLFMPKQKELQLSGAKERRLAKVKANKERSTVSTAQRLDRFSFTQNFLRQNRIEWLQSPHCHLRRLFKREVKTRRNWIQIIASPMSLDKVLVSKPKFGVSVLKVQVSVSDKKVSVSSCMVLCLEAFRDLSQFLTK